MIHKYFYRVAVFELCEHDTVAFCELDLDEVWEPLLHYMTNILRNAASNIKK